MAAPVSAANIKLGADISGLLSGLRTASQALNQHTAGINQGLTRAYREADSAARTLRTGIGRLGAEVQDIGKKMAVIGTLPAIFAAGAAFKQYADLQKLTIGLKQYGESINTVKELAKLPNVSIEGAAQSLIQLRAVGIESNVAQRGIKAFANALTAAGKSSTDLNPALTNVVQMLSTGTVSAADVKELANRIPQARKALQTAFGTTSGEALTKIGSEKVVMGLITELEKIPPVAGGAGMALEKFGDSAQFAAATMGESIDKAFGLTKIISDLADGLGDATDMFADLSPDTQKFSLSLVALAAAAPIVVTAIGAIISASGALAIGLGVTGATVGAVAAAVVVGGALIITYWDDIKSVLTDSGLWSTLSGMAESTMGAIVSTFKTVGSLLSMNWEKAFHDISNVTANITNGINSLVFGTVKMVGILIGNIATLIGFDGFGKWIREQSYGLDKLLEKIRIAETAPKGQVGIERRATRRANEDFAAGEAAAKAEQAAKRLEIVVPVTNLASLSIKELGERLSGLKDAYENLKPGEANYIATKGSIAKQVKQITGLIADQSKGISISSKKNKESLKDTAEGYKYISTTQEKIAAIDLSTKWEKEQAQLKATEKAAKELLSVTAALNVEMLKPRGSTIGGSLQSGLDKSKANLSGLMDQRISASGGPASKSGLERYEEMYAKKSGESAEEYTKRLGDIKKATDTSNEQINQSIRGTAAQVGVSFGEMIGNLATGVDSIQSFGKRVIGALGSMLKEIGKSLIAFGTAGKALEFFKEKPGLAIAAGIAVTAIGQALSASVTKSSQAKFAKGGFAYGEMQATVGDNPNARFDPEMIAPYSKVHNSIEKSIKESNANSGGGWFQKEILIKGQDLAIILERANARNNFIKGSY